MRSYLRTLDLNRIISAYKKRKKDNEQTQILAMQGDNRKELEPTYTLQAVRFDDVTRMAQIDFLQKQAYRTIDRYITRNYEKYPIYSYWKTKTKIITKNIKLTNGELECLNHNPDFLIKTFAGEIVIALNNKSLLPSWFLADCLNSNYQEKLQTIDNEFSTYKTDAQNSINNCGWHIFKTKSELAANRQSLCEQQKILKKINNTLNKIQSYHSSVLKSIFTLFIYNYLKSSKRKSKFLKKQSNIQGRIAEIEAAINKNNVCIKECVARISAKKEEIAAKQTETENLKAQEKKYLTEHLQEITPLPDVYIDTMDFIPLKNLLGYSYVKIIGCYVIRNVINQKCYVGQSKDVFKRLHQHFKGTTPKNIIFAEDYYSTSQDKQDSLFEVKIIECKTKDELDRTEKQLIFDYEAFTKGYNGTNGNS